MKRSQSYMVLAMAVVLGACAEESRLLEPEVEPAAAPAGDRRDRLDPSCPETVGAQLLPELPGCDLYGDDDDVPAEV